MENAGLANVMKERDKEINMLKKHNLTEIKTNISQFQHDLILLKDKLKKRSDECHNYEIKIQESSWIIKSLKTNLLEKEEKIADLRLNFKSNTPTSTVITSAANSHENVGLKTQILGSCSATMQLIREYDAKLQDSQNKINNAERLRASAEEMIKSIKDTIVEKDDEINQNKIIIRQKCKIITETEDIVRASASEIKTLENRLELTGHNIENYETQIGSLRSSINNSTATIYDKDSKIRFLNREIDTFKSDNFALEEKVKFGEVNQIALLQKFRSEIEDYANEILQLRDVISTQENRTHVNNGSYEIEVSQLKENLIKTNSILTQKKNEMFELSHIQEQYRAKIEELQIDLTEKDEALIKFKVTSQEHESSIVRYAAEAQNSERKLQLNAEETLKLRKLAKTLMQKICEQDVSNKDQEKQCFRDSETIEALTTKIAAHEELHCSLRDEYEILLRKYDKEKEDNEFCKLGYEEKYFRMVEEYEHEISEHGQSVVDGETIIETNNAEIKSLENTIAGLRDTIERTESTSHEQDIKIRGFEHDVKNLDDSIRKQNITILNLRKEIENLQQGIRQKIMENNVHERNIQSLEREVTTLKLKSTKDQQMLSGYNTETENTKRVLEEKISSLTQKINQLKEIFADNEITFKNTNIKNLNKIKDQEITISDISNDKENSVKMLNMQKFELEAAQNIIKESEIQANQQNIELNDCKRKITEFKRSIANDVSKGPKYEEEISGLKQAVANYDNELSNKTQLVYDQEATIRNLERKMLQLHDQVKKLNSKIVQSEQLHITLKETNANVVEDMKNQSLELREEIEYLETKVATNMEEFAQMDDNNKNAILKSKKTIQMKDRDMKNTLRLMNEQKYNIANLKSAQQEKDILIETLEQEKGKIENEQIRQERILQKMCAQVHKSTEVNTVSRNKIKRMEKQIKQLKEKGSEKDHEIAKLIYCDKQTSEYLVNQQKLHSSKQSEFNLKFEKLNQKITNQDRVIIDLKSKFSRTLGEYEDKCFLLEEENQKMKEDFNEDKKLLKILNNSAQEKELVYSVNKKALEEKERLIKLQNDLIEKRSEEIQILIGRQNPLIERDKKSQEFVF